jgi:flagellar biosynthesis activator protein FlaF
MTVTTQDKVGAYTTNQRQNEDSRETDKRALLSCASRLKAALDAGGQDMKEYGEAIKHNQKLWTVFQVSLCDPENALPRDLKLTLLGLSRYIDKTSFRAITEFAPQLLNSLIDINRIIAGGLNPVVKAENPELRNQAPPAVPQGSVATTA